MEDYTNSTFLSYNRFNSLPNIPYNILTYIFGNENLMKLLYYTTPDALDKPILTDDQKVGMIWDGIKDYNTDGYRLFTDAYLDDSISFQIPMIRCYIAGVTPYNRIQSKVDVCIEILSHVKINTLNNYTKRHDSMFTELMKTLNGADNIDSTGVLSFDREANIRCGAGFKVWNNRNYVGYMIILNTFINEPTDGNY